jgi:hypothetical protein
VGRGRERRCRAVVTPSGAPPGPTRRRGGRGSGARGRC